MCLNYKALMELSIKEAADECDFLFPPNSKYWYTIRKREKPKITQRKYLEKINHRHI